MKTTNKKVTLPDGVTCRVRGINGEDMLECGNVPDVFAEAKQSSASDPKAREFGVKFTKSVIVNCLGPLVYPDGKEVKIVEKRFFETKNDEISVEEFMSTEEAAILVAEVTALSGCNKAAQDAARPFPAEQKGVDSGSPDGQAVSVPAV